LFGKTNYIEYYDAQEIEETLALDRHRLIMMAMFLGSDYTLGIRGVGIVNAMEIVETFDNE
jgi:DNA excision repair protein ERCC-5